MYPCQFEIGNVYKTTFEWGTFYLRKINDETYHVLEDTSIEGLIKYNSDYSIMGKLLKDNEYKRIHRFELVKYNNDVKKAKSLLW